MISRLVFPFDVIEKLAALGNQLQKPQTGMVIADVGLEMRAQIVDSFGENGYLNKRRPRVLVVPFVLLDHFSLLYFADRHASDHSP